MKLKRLKNRLEDNDISLNFNFEYIKNIVTELKDDKNKTQALSEKILSEITPYISETILSGEEEVKLLVDKKQVNADHIA